MEKGHTKKRDRSRPTPGSQSSDQTKREKVEKPSEENSADELAKEEEMTETWPLPSSHPPSPWSGPPYGPPVFDHRLGLWLSRYFP